MSAIITLAEAQANLAQLVHDLAKGEEVAITEGNQVVARIVGERSGERKPRVPGNCKGMITLAAQDEEHLKDFEEYYMP